MEAIAKVVVPGRLEIVGRYPLVIRDAAHNPDGARALAGELARATRGAKPVVGVIALLAGTLAGWVIAFAILDVPFTFDAQAVLITVVGGAAATLLFGLLGALGALSVRPAQRLRSS